MSNICWLKITDYIRGWARHTLGTHMRVHGEPVISVAQLPGAQEALAMEAVEGLPIGNPGNAISATWMNALQTGAALDPQAIELEYGITPDYLRQYLPIACPDNAFTDDGIFRPWTHDIAFGDKQSTALQKVLRNAFWTAVQKFSVRYQRQQHGRHYAQIEMIEAFCKATRTDDIYAEAMRREWQRRLKHGQNE